MTDIFISYKREDREYARSIAELLVTKGYDVWWDIELLPGDRFADEINEVLSNARVAIVLWTPDSIQSNWVKSEASIALNKEILVPICLRETDIPAPFNTLHTLDLTNWDGEGAETAIENILKAVEKKIGIPKNGQETKSEQEISEALKKPQHEVEFWTSITTAAYPTIEEYQLYIDTYGLDGSFTKLALSRIKDLKQNRSKGPNFKDKLMLVSITMGIAVAGFTIADIVGFFKYDKFEENVKPTLETAKPEKIILEKFPKVIAVTISTWGGGSHSENCVPPLTKKAGYVLVGGNLGPSIQHSERHRVGCPPPGHCDGLNEYCTTIERSSACYVNQAWYDWKVKELAKTASNIDYQTICES